MHTVKAKMFRRIADLCLPVIQLTQGIIVMLDFDGKIISFNELLESATGYSYSELIQKNCFDLFFSGKEKITARRYFRRYLLKGEAPQNITSRIVARSGEDRFIEWHCRRFEDEASGDVIGLLAVGRDVSASVRHEKQLLNERNQLIERNKELTCLYSIAKIVGQNTTLSHMLESIAAVIPPAFQFPEIAAAIIRLDQHFYGGCRTLTDSLSLTEALVINQIPRGHIQVVYSPPKNDSKMSMPSFLEEEHALLKNIAHHLALAIEKKEALDHQAEMERQLRHSDRLAKIGQLTAGVAHELNEPLGNILGLAQLSSKAAGLSAQVQNDLENIIKAALHAREVIKKLMFFSRQTPPRQTLVDLNRLIEEGLYLFESRCAKNGIAVKKTLCRDLPAIKADLSQLQQVLTNLIVNALHAMPEEGTLSIETSYDEDHVRLAVQDTGTGMTPETLKQIFLPFFTTKDIKEGTGLGLSVVHGIVKSHGGSIEVDSRVGHGSCFKIKFPLKSVLPEKKNG